MMIDKASRNMLDLLIAAEPDMPRNAFSYDAICELSALDEDDMYPIAKGLVAQGLAESANYFDGPDLGIALTQKGLCYKELLGLERNDRWRERLWGFLSGAVLATIPWLLGLLVG